MTNRSRNAVSRRNISTGGYLRKNIIVWKRKHKDYLDKNHEAIIKHINKPLIENSSQLIFDKYKKKLRELKNDERKQITKRKKNIKNFIKKNKTIIEKHDNDTELRLDENSPDYVFKEFKRLVKQWKYEDEFNELVNRYPDFNYQPKRRKKLKPGEKRTRRKKPEPIIPKISLRELKNIINKEYALSIKYKTENELSKIKLVDTKYVLNQNSATPIVEQNIDEQKKFILKLVKHEYKLAEDKTKNETSSNVLGSDKLLKFRLFVKLVFQTSTPSAGIGHFSKVITVDDISESNQNQKEFWKSIDSKIEEELNAVTNKNFDTEDYTIDLYSIDISYSKAPNKGGCCESKYKKENWTKFKEMKFFPGLQYSFRSSSFESRNNNCAFTVFNRKYGISGRSANAKQIPFQIRNKLGLKEGEKIDMKHIPFISEFYNKKFETNYTYMLTDFNGVPYEKFSTFSAFDPKPKIPKNLTKEQIEKQKQDKQIYLAQLAYCSRDENGKIIGPRHKNPTPKKNETKEIKKEIETALDNFVIICYSAEHYSSAGYVSSEIKENVFYVEESF